MLKYYVGLLCSLLLLSLISFGQGADCVHAEPMCSDSVITFPSSVGTNAYDLYSPGLRGCLGNVPNPAWYYLKIGNPGPINIFISQLSSFNYTGIDVDFACWGPFPTSEWNTICTVGLGPSWSAPTHRPWNGDHSIDKGVYPLPPPSKMIDCSYSPEATEWCYIPNAKRGEFYLLCLTNFSNMPGNISFERLPIPGSGTTDCSILGGAVGDTICYGQDVKLKIPRTRKDYKYHFTLPSGGKYPATRLVGNGSDIEVTIPASELSLLPKGSYTFGLTTWDQHDMELGTVDVKIIVEELDTKAFSYWKDITDKDTKRMPVCEGQEIFLGFGGDIPTTLTGELPPLFYEQTEAGYTFLGTSNVAGNSYLFKHTVNGYDTYVVDRKSELGQCQLLKEPVTLRKKTGPNIKLTIADGVTPHLPAGIINKMGQEGNLANNDPSLPPLDSKNVDGYWAPLSNNPHVIDNGITPVPDRGTIGNDAVLYTLTATPVPPSSGIKKTYFLGFTASELTDPINTWTDYTESSMTAIAVDNEDCESRKDTTITRLIADNIKLTISVAPDTTVCGYAMVDIKAKVIYVKEDSYFPLTLKWQTLDDRSYIKRTDLPLSSVKYGTIGDGGNGDGNGYEEQTVTLASRDDIFTFKARVGTLIRVYAESRDLPSGKFRSLNYHSKIIRMPVAKVTKSYAFERETDNNGMVKEQPHEYFCSGNPVSIIADGVRDYRWIIDTPDDPNPVSAGTTKEARLPELINKRTGKRTVRLDYVGFNGCSNDTTFQYEILPLPIVQVSQNVDKAENCVFETKTLTVKVDDKNKWLEGKPLPVDEKGVGGRVYPPTSDSSYTWKPSYKINPTIGKNVTVSPDTTTVYGVTFKDTRGCMGSWSGAIQAPVRVKGVAKSQYCEGEDIHLSVKLLGNISNVILDAVKYEYIKEDGTLEVLKDFDNTAMDYTVFQSDIQVWKATIPFEEGSYTLRFRVTGKRDGCEGVDTVTVKIRRTPNFKIEIFDDITAGVTNPTGMTPTSLPPYSSSTNPWEIHNINDFAIIRLRFDNNIDDNSAQYSLKVKAQWDLVTPTNTQDSVKPYYRNNPADTVMKITPREKTNYKIKVVDTWYDMFVRKDSAQCESEFEYLEISGHVGIKIDSPGEEIKENAAGQRIMSICKEKIFPDGLFITVKDKNGADVKQVEQVAWYRVKLNQSKYVPVAGGYCTGKNWACTGPESFIHQPFTVDLPSDGIGPTAPPFKGEFANITPAGNYREVWLDSLSTFALVVKAKSQTLGVGYDVLYVTVLPQPKKPDFTIDAPLSAYRDKENKYSFEPFTDNRYIKYLDSTYNVWCYNQPYDLMFTDKTLTYQWSSRKGIKQDIYDESLYKLSPDTLTLYKVKAQNHFGCLSFEREILVHPITRLELDSYFPKVICKNDSAEIKFNNDLKRGQTLKWYLGRNHFSDNDDKKILTISFKDYGVAQRPDTIKITLESEGTFGYSYLNYFSPNYSVSGSNPKVRTEVPGCIDSLVLIKKWLNVPEIGAIVPRDTLLIRYDNGTHSYNLCLGSAPDFEVLTVQEAEEKGIPDYRRANLPLEGNNNPDNSWFLWNYDPALAEVGWIDSVSTGTIRPIQQHDPKDYSLTVYNWDKSCKENAKVKIRAEDAPKIPFGYAPKRINRKYQSVKFTYDNNPQYQYDWNLDKTNPTFTEEPPQSGTNYYFQDNTKNKWIGRVVVSKEMGCKVEIPINITRGFYIPNTFTPNGDGKNDIFLDPSEDFSYLGDGIEDFRFAIYNRRGQKLYENAVSGENTSIGWDGTYHGEPMPPDVYFYVVEYVYDGEPLIHRGSITLLR